MKQPENDVMQLYQPSEKLRQAQQELLAHYSLEDIIKTLRLLSRSMASGEMAYDDAIIDRRDRADMVEARTMGIIGDDLLSVCSLIQTIDAQKPLERSLSHEDGNDDLQLFAGKERKVPKALRELAGKSRIREQAPLERCIAVTKKWCNKQKELLDDQATELAHNAGAASGDELATITRRLEVLDTAAGMLYYLEAWAKVAIQEVHKARNPEREDGSSLAI